MPDITMPDGSVVKNVPDTPEAAAQLAQAWKASQAPKEPSPFDNPAVHAAAVGGSGLVRGLLSVPDNVPQIKALTNLSTRAARSMAEYVAPGQTPSGPLPALKDIGAQARTPEEKYLNAGTEGAGAALVGSGGQYLKAPIIGAASGLGGEGAANYFGDNKWIRLLGSLIGGVGAGGVTGLAKGQAGLVKDVTAGTTPEDLAKAVANMKATQATGLGTVNASQAMPVNSPIDKMISLLAGSKYGTKTQAQLNQQPQQVADALSGQIQGMPGLVVRPRDATNAAQDAATESIGAVKAARTADYGTTVSEGLARNQAIADNRVASLSTQLNATKDPNDWAKLYPQLRAAQNDAKYASAADPQAVLAEVRRLRGVAAAHPNTEVEAAANDLAGRMLDSKGNPLTDPGQINGALKSFGDTMGSSTLATPGLTSGAQKLMRGQVQQVKANLGKAFEPVRAADAQFADTSTQIVNPLKRDAVGSVAGVAGFDESKTGVDKITKIFNDGTIPGSERSDILELEKQLHNTPGGPEAFQNAWKTWVTGKTTAATDSKGLPIASDLPGKMQALFGDPAKATPTSQGTKDMLVALARSQGQDDSTYVRGFQNVQTFLTQAAKRPGSVGTSEQAFGKTMEGSTGEATRLTNIQSLMYGVRKILGGMDSARSQKFFDNLLTTPEGLSKLAEMAKSPPMSTKAITTMGTLLGANASGNSPPITPQ